MEMIRNLRSKFTLMMILPVVRETQQRQHDLVVFRMAMCPNYYPIRGRKSNCLCL